MKNKAKAEKVQKKKAEDEEEEDMVDPGETYIHSLLTYNPIHSLINPFTP